MTLNFMQVDYRRTPSVSQPMTVYLEADTWDDFGFKTTKKVTLFDKNANKHELGFVRIGKIGQTSGYTDLPKSFEILDDQYFSLGFSVEYYKKIYNLDGGLKEAFLESIRDIVILDDTSKDKILKEGVAKISLLRSISKTTIDGQYKRILNGEAELTPFHFKYYVFKNNKQRCVLYFEVKPNSSPPTNVHAIIGPNGVGKTNLFKDMARNFIGDERSIGKFALKDSFNEDEIVFSKLVTISYSAFDSFETVGHHPLYFQIGNLKEENSLGEEFYNSVKYCFATQNNKWQEWKMAIKKLESDPIFKSLDIISNMQYWLNEDEDKNKNEIINFFDNLSSGHSIILLIITRLIEKMEEKMLILIDEPENHLHPPLLSTFIGVLSWLLIKKNAVAIIATHSPIVAQEIPKSCMYKLSRFGDIVKAERFDMETFGASISNLTNEIFGLEVTKSGFYSMLDKDVNSNMTCAEIFEKYNNQLGLEAKAILNALIYNRDKTK